ncbi:YncE family protein [Furfurilactobacillus curtus]|uniref:WD40 repeat domain-containing protein n=1 Tax=Furfurilactobacillus curtus TaxID=1746200 RepID=A0ABQ5JUH4_9LACO
MSNSHHMKGQLVAIASLLLLSIATWTILGPLRPPKAVTKAANAQMRSRFSLANLRQDLERYPGLIRASLDAYPGQNAEGTYLVPGLTEQETLKPVGHQFVPIRSQFMTPQGVTVTPKYVITTAYDHSNRGNSVLNILDRQTGSFIKRVILQGRPHVGGITYQPDAKVLWVCGAKDGRAQLFSIKLTSIDRYKARTNRPIAYQHSALLPTIQRASLVAYQNGYLWVGFFSPFGNSTVQRFNVHDVETNSHTLKSRFKAQGLFDGVFQRLTSQETIGKIQGLSFYKDNVYLSQSFGPEDSWLYIYHKNLHRQRFTPAQAVARVRMPAHLEQITCPFRADYHSR